MSPFHYAKKEIILYNNGILNVHIIRNVVYEISLPIRFYIRLFYAMNAACSRIEKLFVYSANSRMTTLFFRIITWDNLV